MILAVVSWCDGNIGQLQIMIFESQEAKDEKEQTCWNKHFATATSTQRPANRAPIFRILRQTASFVTAKCGSAVGLVDTIQTLFSTTLRKQGLNLDGNHQKKKALRVQRCRRQS